MQTVRRAAVCGKPIAHSLSPVIHRAGFAAAGLTGWEYTAFECAETELATLVEGLGPEWAGLSLTMPLKEVALGLAAEASPTATATGAANTLVRRDDGSWYADNTDVPGMVRVLNDAGLPPQPSITVLGGGGTARAALAAAARLGAREVTVVTRRPQARASLKPAADALGVRIAGAGWADAAATLDADAVIATVPKGAADQLAAEAKWRAGTILFDALYDPWPTPLAASAQAQGLAVASGLDLLLAQALSQFEQFTGVPAAPEAAMREALLAAAAARARL
ncbi:shikimate dehydrogenase [Actinoplanes sp. TBRC 11911]|uniref:shikimate dehydrogenase n=1 Tax=Actinoplanes sp. TBRC 11911 TaxID=2729386 RepID=UPI00145F2F71|nr:shikimate dehydrogenase [Actinoplanes sp. TBRC 11911]NMO56298.1 shikimate dehydrogenase [Actinoplanes sp. TBRC 11911]